MLTRVQKLRNTLDLAADADTRRKISEEGRLLRQEIERIRNQPEFARSVVRAEMDELLEGLALHISSRLDDRTNQQIQRLAGLARESLTRTGVHALEDARRSLAEIRSLLFGALAKLPDFWLARFESLAENRSAALDKALHDELVRTGESSIKANDVDGLRHIVFRLSNNQVQAADVGKGDILSGLTRH